VPAHQDYDQLAPEAQAARDLFRFLATRGWQPSRAGGGQWERSVLVDGQPARETRSAAQASRITLAELQAAATSTPAPAPTPTPEPATA
jgi:hypothetical protein